MKGPILTWAMMAAVLACVLSKAKAFQGLVAGSTSSRAFRSTTQLQAASYGQCLEIGYVTEVTKPLGVIFGENADPYYGLVVDDVSEGMNGGKAGLRVGDQLLAINGQVVVGNQFDDAMALFAQTDKLELVMYRGPVSALFTILMNKMGDDEIVGDDEYDEGEEEVIMDENYESPVVIEVKERKPLSAGDVFKAMGKLGKMMLEDDTPEEVKAQRKEEKKKSGFFGLGAESIQLDGDDANTLK